MSLSICTFCGGHISLNPCSLNRCTGCGRDAFERDPLPPVGGIDDSELVALRAEVARLRKELELTRGAMRAQDEREAEAGAMCGVPAELHGCDWPDAVADHVLILKNENEVLKRIERQRWENVNKTFGTAYLTAPDQHQNIPMPNFGTRRPGDF